MNLMRLVTKVLFLNLIIFFALFFSKNVFAKDFINVATANFNGDYRSIGDMIIKHDIDVIGLQEFGFDESGSSKKLKADRVKEYLASKGLQYNTMSIGYFGGTVTATIVFKYAFHVNSYEQYLMQIDQPRPIQRINLTTNIGDVTFINYHGGADCTTLGKIRSWINSLNDKNIIWVGDFNENFLYEPQPLSECATSLLNDHYYSCESRDLTVCKTSSKNAGQLNVCEYSRNIVYDYVFLQKTSDYEIKNSFVETTVCDWDHYPVIASITKKSQGINLYNDINNDKKIDLMDIFVLIQKVFL